MSAFSALVLAGGAAQRMGGAAKPTLTVGGVPMLTRVLEATGAAAPRIVVGPVELVALLPKGVSLTTEHPPGGGPVAALAAGLALLTPDWRPPLVAVLASDLPFLTAPAVEALVAAVAGEEVDGAVLVDDADHPQWLAGVWRVEALAARMPANPAGVGMRKVVSGLRLARVGAPADRPPAWFDCDTDEDIRRAKEWTDAG